MAEVVAERVRRYVLDGSDEDLRRLLRISQLTAEAVRAASRRVGVSEGWRAVDCGCGPIPLVDAQRAHRLLAARSVVGKNPAGGLTAAAPLARTVVPWGPAIAR